MREMSFAIFYFQLFQIWVVWMNSKSQVAKIRMKVGAIELEYEGDAAFLEGDIEALFERMSGLLTKTPANARSRILEAEESAVDGKGDLTSTGNGHFSLSTNTIAAHLDAKTGPQLVMCAMAQIELIQGKASSSRHEVISEMKNATTYYKQTMVNNLSTSLSGFVKAKRINQIAKDTYALNAAERKQFEAKLAEIG